MKIYLENSPTTSGASAFFPSGLDQGGVSINQREITVREAFLKAGLAINLLVRSFICIVGCIQGSLAFDTVETLFVPCIAFGSLAFIVKDLLKV